MSRFAGKTIIVTGAGSGIGRATAVRIAGEGGRVIGTDVSKERLGELSDLLTVPGDITDASVIDSILETAGPRIDGLANVAGIMDGFLPAAEVDDATWERVLAVNLTGPMRLTRAVLPLMLAAGSGAIVNVASEAVLHASAAGAAYTASKHGLVGFTQNVAFFYGPEGVRANVVAPGPVMTNIEASMRSQFAAGRVGPVMQATMPRPVGPEVVASTIAWLLSEDAGNVNGALLPCDGGWSVA